MKAASRPMEFEDILQQENFERLPEYLQEAVESAVLGYYENKGYPADRLWHRQDALSVEDEGPGRRIGQRLLSPPFGRIQVDLYNIRTMLRLKMAQRDDREFLLRQGFVDMDKFVHGLAAPYESVSGLFFATPYYEMIEEGVRYLRSEQSFLKLEQQCEDYMMGFLKSTKEIAAGPQPVIAYFLMKEAEIRTYGWC